MRLGFIILLAALVAACGTVWHVAGEFEAGSPPVNSEEH